MHHLLLRGVRDIHHGGVEHPIPSVVGISARPATDVEGVLAGLKLQSEPDRHQGGPSGRKRGDESARHTQACREDDLTVAIPKLATGAHPCHRARRADQDDRLSPIPHPETTRGCTIGVQQPGFFHAHPAVAKSLASRESEGGRIGRPRVIQTRRIHRRHWDVSRERGHGRHVLADAGSRFPEKTHPAAVEPHGAPAHAEHKGQIVGDHEQGHAGVDEFAKTPAAFLLEDDVPHAERLVDDQDIGLDGDRDGERDAHHHARGVGLHRLPEEVADVGERRDGIESPLHLRPGDAKDRAAEKDVLAARKLRVEAGAELEQRGRSPADRELAGGRLQSAGEDLQERAFPGPVAPDHAECFPAGNLEGDIMQGRRRAGVGHPASADRPPQVSQQAGSRLVALLQTANRHRRGRRWARRRTSRFFARERAIGGSRKA